MTDSVQIEHNVAGPRGQPGILLVAPPDEALAWDIEREIASASRTWLEDRQAWWIARPYLGTVLSLLRRVAPHAARPDRAEAAGES